MLKENIRDIKVVGEVKKCEYSQILKLDDGRLAKIISPLYLCYIWEWEPV